ncbi:MAG: PAS domain S-box protein [Phycisphaeraceae bacterium]|nr:PAS domain S-box protein [Phycisphaeraceae bacterium]
MKGQSDGGIPGGGAISLAEKKPTGKVGGQTAPGAEVSLMALQDSAQWLRVTLNSIGDGVITTDQNGIVTMVNPVAQQLTGWTQEMAFGRSLIDVFHIVNQETRAEVSNPALRALEQGIIVGLANHTILIAKDGTERNIDDSAAPIKNDKGAVAGSILVFRDITERYKQEQLVRDGRAYAENILRTLRHPFVVLDKDLRVVSANHSFYSTFHVEPGDTEGRLIFDLGSGQWNIQELRGLLEDILPKSGNTIEDFEVVHEFPEIGRRVMLLNARKVARPGNHSNLILLVIEDITERRAAEENLRDSEMRYRRLFQTAKDGILILNAKTGKITDANAFMGGLVGQEASELLGKELHEIGMFGDVDASKHAFRELQENGYVRYEHLPVKNQHGGSVEVEVVANIYQEDHTLVAQCNVRDISQRVVLEKKVQEQTEQLAEESRRKDEFLAMLSHELRNPLAPIRSALYLLKSQDKGSENSIQRQAREIIERQVGSLTKLVSDLLEVSRVVTGRIRLDLHKVELGHIVDRALETVTPLIRHHRHEVVLHPCPDGLWVSGDATRLEEIFVNILNNAAKYTPEGGKIDIWCEHCERDQTQVRVRDTGVGITEDLLAHGRLFDLFAQADRSLDRAAGGLGIGLSLVQRLVALHSGTVEAKSDGLGKGSEFIVRLPRTKAPDLEASPEPGAAASHVEGRKEGAGCRGQCRPVDAGEHGSPPEGVFGAGRRERPGRDRDRAAVEPGRGAAGHRPAGREWIRGGAALAGGPDSPAREAYRADRIRA